jgi:hypothetical protein
MNMSVMALEQVGFLANFEDPDPDTFQLFARCGASACDKSKNRDHIEQFCSHSV